MIPKILLSIMLLTVVGFFIPSVIFAQDESIKELFETGEEFFYKAQFNEAIKYYEMALEKSPNNMFALNKIGESIFYLGEYENAIEWYDKALKINPNDVYTLNNKGIALRELGKFEEALIHFNKALQGDPAFIHSLNHKGLTLEGLGKFEEALLEYNKALEVDPKNIWSLNNKAIVLVILERFDESIETFNESLIQDPKNIDSLLGMALISAEYGHYSEANELFYEVLRYDPTNKAAIQGLKFVEKAIYGEVNQAEFNQAKQSWTPQRAFLEFTPIGHVLKSIFPKVHAETTPEQVEPQNENGGCLIATATYGSELSYQVQQLREIRDNSLLKTKAGSQFMNSFNDVYYTFSPAIADYERENPLFKELVKLAITPMISSLSILSLADQGSEAQVLGFGISVIALNLGMYFVAPAAISWKICNHFKSKKCLE